MNKIIRRVALGIAAALAVPAFILGKATPAEARTVECKAVNFPVYMALNDYVYSDGLKLVATATHSYVQPVTAGPDITWTFYSFTGYGAGGSPTLQPRYYTNSQTWGGSAGNRLPVKDYTVTATYKRVDSLGHAQPNRTITCTI